MPIAWIYVALMGQSVLQSAAPDLTCPYPPICAAQFNHPLSPEKVFTNCTNEGSGNNFWCGMEYFPPGSLEAKGVRATYKGYLARKVEPVMAAKNAALLVVRRVVRCCPDNCASCCRDDNNKCSLDGHTYTIRTFGGDFFGYRNDFRCPSKYSRI